MPTSGSFTLTINNQTAANIAHNATAATVQSRLEALSSIGSGNVKCAEGPLPDQAVYIEFVGTLANRNISPLSGSSSLSPATLVLSTPMEGGLAQLAAQHDRSGNMTRVPDVFKKEKVECVYDAWNRLVAVTKGGTEVVRYGYGGLHRRITKTLPGQSIRHYYYSLDHQVLEERVIPGLNGKTKVEEVNADRWYVWGIRGLDDLVTRGRITAVDPLQVPGYTFERQFALQDANFNVTAITDYDGDVVERFTHDPYGQFEIYDANYRARIKSKYDWDILYGGYRYDFESGLYHVRRRQFSPSLGRWLQTDPLGYVDSYNLYQYCHGSPVNSIDPTGEFDPLIWLGIGLLALGLSILVPSLAHAPGSREDVSAIPALERQQFETNARTVAFLVSLPVGGWTLGATRGYGLFWSGVATGLAAHATTDVVMAGAMGDPFYNYRDDSGNVSVTDIVASYSLSGLSGGLLNVGLGVWLPWLRRRMFGPRTAFGTRGNARFGRGKGRRFGRSKVRPGEEGTTYATAFYTKYQHWLLRHIPWLRRVTYRDISYGARTAGARRHELAHVMFLKRFPQIAHLAARQPCFPGKGLASVIMELHGNVARYGRNVPAVLWQTLSDVNHLAIAGDVGVVFGIYGWYHFWNEER